MRLPNDLRINDLRVGISSKDREQAAILSKCGKFGETSLKLLSEIQANHTNPIYMANCIDNLYITQVALVRYIQEELSGLVIGSQFGGMTKTVFRALQKHTSVYMPDVIDSLKTAVTLTQNSIQAIRTSRIKVTINPEDL